MRDYCPLFCQTIRYVPINLLYLFCLFVFVCFSSLAMLVSLVVVVLYAPHQV